MTINPQTNEVSFSMENLSDIEQILNGLQRLALENDGVDSDAARNIVSDLNRIRDNLSLKAGIKRHDKFVPKGELTPR